MKRKKILAIVVGLALLACISVTATLAYVTSVTETVTNTFTVGDVDITLYEWKVDSNGKYEEPIAQVQGNRYLLIPGKTYDLYTKVRVAPNSDDCWLFVKIDNQIHGILTRESGYTVESQLQHYGWTLLSGAGTSYDDGRAVTVYYRERSKSDPKAEYEVLNAFKVDPNVEAGTLADYQNKQIDVTAYAVQKENVATAAAAWAIVEKLKPDTDGNNDD